MPYGVRDKFRPRMQRETRGAELALPGGVREGFLQKVTPSEVSIENNWRVMLGRRDSRSRSIEK